MLLPSILAIFIVPPSIQNIFLWTTTKTRIIQKDGWVLEMKDGTLLCKDHDPREGREGSKELYLPNHNRAQNNQIKLSLSPSYILMALMNLRDKWLSEMSMRLEAKMRRQLERAKKKLHEGQRSREILATTSALYCDQDSSMDYRIAFQISCKQLRLHSIN